MLGTGMENREVLFSEKRRTEVGKTRARGENRLLFRALAFAYARAQVERGVL